MPQKCSVVSEANGKQKRQGEMVNSVVDRKKCSRCQETKLIGNFGVSQGYRKSWCKLCESQYRMKKKTEIYKAEPWLRHFNNAMGRCCSKGAKYFKRGIKFLITKNELKEIWFRDKAYLLKNPSIDRIDSGGNYTRGNCQFIEIEENRRRDRAVAVDQYSMDGNFIKHFNTLHFAAIAMGRKRIIGNISNAAHGRLNKGCIAKTAYGYKWKLSAQKEGG